MLALLVLVLLAQVKATVTLARVSCVMNNHPTILVHHHEDGTATEEEVDDWWVDCTITKEDKKIYNAPLSLAHPTTIHDATVAIDDFRKRQAPVILKEYKEGKKEP